MKQNRKLWEAMRRWGNGIANKENGTVRVRSGDWGGTWGIWGGWYFVREARRFKVQGLMLRAEVG